jgi:plasmid stabilization system protein ParE
MLRPRPMPGRALRAAFIVPATPPHAASVRQPLSIEEHQIARLPGRPPSRALLPAAPAIPPSPLTEVAPPVAVAAIPIHFPAPEPQPIANALALRGDYWEVRYRGATAVLEDSRGLRYIALLIRDAHAPNGPLHAKELAALATGQRPETTELEPHDQVLDDIARQQLTARLADIATDRDRACAVEDFTRAAELDAEHERITAEFVHGTRRGTFNDTAERARKAVAKAISDAVARIASHPELAPLAAHLTTSIRKGQWLSYSDSTAWHVDFRPPLPRK